MPTQLPDIELVAFNTATSSENKIHDDTVAAKLGFGGGLVPGVDVYAYLCRPAIEAWGERFLTASEVEVRLGSPVYDGEVTTIRSAIDDDGFLTAEAWSRDLPCATLTARLVDQHGEPPAVEETPAPDFDDRPPATPDQVTEGRTLGTVVSSLDAEAAATYLDEVRDADSPVTGMGAVHPGWLLRHANHSLSHTVLLGPWIHVGSAIRHRRVLPVGAELRTRGRIAEAYERKGHRFVVLDVAMVTDDETVVADVTHTAIVEPRQVRTDLA